MLLYRLSPFHDELSAFGSHKTAHINIYYTQIKYYDGYFNNFDNAEHACRETIMVRCIRNAPLELCENYF
jgi:hypothetical protein